MATETEPTLRASTQAKNYWASSVNETAESRCICGQVKLQFLRPVPVLHAHCCCRDCRQGREWSAVNGGPPMRQGPTLLYYFENDLMPPEPRMLANLFAVKLRDNGRTTRLISRCCHSAVALDHPYYDQNVVCVHANACVLAASNIEPLSRIFTKDWDPTIDGEMPPVTASLEDSETMWTKFASFIKRPVQERSGITLQHVFAQLRPPTILGLSEGARLVPQASGHALG
jgi:hypothetical protein